jgi:hypothetical protein
VVLRLLAIVAIAFGALACSPSGPTPGQTQSAVETPSPAELEAIRFRTESGLRADLDYVRVVAADPSASSREFSVPLMPAEIAELNARAANADAIRGAIQAYADLHPSDFGGMYIDQQNGGAVTTLWTAHLADHVAAVWRRIRPGSRVAFRLVAFNYRDLRALQDRIGGDWDWMRAFAIAPEGVGVDVIANDVEVDVSSANANAAALILAHYAVPAGMIAVVSDGTGAALLPWGTVRGRVLDSRGKPPGEAVAAGLNLSWTSDGPGRCGIGDIGYGVGGSGGFELPCQVGGHTFEVQVPAVIGGPKTIASGRVVVLAGEIVELGIRLDQPWSSVATP